MASFSKVPALQPQIPPSSSSSSSVPPQPPLPDQDDSSNKKNTDCVYFLASPLTCKKGSECEFRHSEAARLNPRDCWYWMNRACLNPKCPFRHPPLDGLSGAPAVTSGGTSLPPVPAIPSVKQGVPCIFFQRGYCLKGDRCPFIHGSTPSTIKVPQAPAAGTTDPSAPRALEKCTQQKIVPLLNASRLVEAVPQIKPISKAIRDLPNNGALSMIYGLPNSGLVEVVPLNKETNAAAVSETSGSKHNNFLQASLVNDSGFQNDKDADELLRESSPGFDVLVDDELGDGDYYHNEDQLLRMRGHDGMNVNELEMDHPDDYNPTVVDPEKYRDLRGYDSYDGLRDKYARECRRGSLESSRGEKMHFPRRGNGEEADLRSRLSKQRRVNGLRSVVNPDCAPDRHDKEKSFRTSHKDSSHSPPRDWPLGSRLQGRIKLPRRSTTNGSSMPLERETDRVRDHIRRSPGGQQLASHRRSLHERLSGRILDETNEGKNLMVMRAKRDVIDDNGANFTGPKSLAELKVAMPSLGKEQQITQEQATSVGKRRCFALESSQPAKVDLSFEGPKPLSEILKRKREAEAAGSAGGIPSGYAKEAAKPSETKESLVKSISSYSTFSDEQIKGQVAISFTQGPVASSPPMVANKVDCKSDGDEGDLVCSDKSKMTGESRQVNDENVYDNNLEGLIAHEEEGDQEHGLIAHEEEEDLEHEREEYEQAEADGAYEYEQEDGEGYNVEDGVNADAELEEDYMDEDDGDDFAKKIGVLLS